MDKLVTASTSKRFQRRHFLLSERGSYRKKRAASKHPQRRALQLSFPGLATLAWGTWQHKWGSWSSWWGCSRPRWGSEHLRHSPHRVTFAIVLERPSSRKRKVMSQVEGDLVFSRGLSNCKACVQLVCIWDTWGQPAHGLGPSCSPSRPWDHASIC